LINHFAAFERNHPEERHFQVCDIVCCGAINRDSRKHPR
jgi:hypothetical protein